MRQLEPPDSFHLNAAQGWWELGNSLEADAELDKITATHRTHPLVLEIRWQIYAKAGKWEACVDLGEAIVEAAMDLPEGWIHRSFALHRLGRTQEAADKLEAAADLFPSVWLIPYNLACYACQLGKRGDAWEWLTDALDLAPDKDTVKVMAFLWRDNPSLGERRV